MCIRKGEEGQILVLTALSAIVLMGFVSLALDVGLLFRARRNLQIAADSAATAAALNYYYNSGSDPNAVADADAVGVNAAAIDNVKVVNGTTVDVHCPVQNGAFASSSCNGYFEAIIQQPNHTLFMGLFNQGSITVGVRAVAGTPYAASDCAYFLKSNGDIGHGGNGNGIGKGDSTVFLFGSFTVSAPHCGVVIDGTGPDALYLSGNGGTMTAQTISVVGQAGGNGNNAPTPAPVTGAAPVQDPLQAIQEPTTDGLTPCPAETGNSVALTNCYINWNSKNNFTLTNPTINGILYFNGTGNGVLEFSGTVTSGANGATIYLASGGMTVDTGTIFAGPTGANCPAPYGCFTAPSSGSLVGIAIMATRGNTNTIEFAMGNSKGAMLGIIYAPDASLYMHDSGGGSSALVLNSDLIVGEFDDQTATLTINSYSAIEPTLTPLKAVALVE